MLVFLALSMNRSPKNKGLSSAKAGFTLIEMLIVLALMAMLIVLSAPFVTSLRSDISMQRTLKQVKTDMVSALSYALAGKSFASLSADELINPDLIPAAYALYFETDTDYGDQTPYRYLELTAVDEGLNSTMELSYDYANEYESPAVYLKGITLTNSETGASKATDSAYIIVIPPFGRLLFVDDDESYLQHVSETDFYQNQQDFDGIQLHLQYKDDEDSLTALTLNKAKVINILEN